MQNQTNVLLQELTKPGWKTSALHNVLILIGISILFFFGIMDSNMVPVQYRWIIGAEQIIFSFLGIAHVSGKYIDYRQSVMDSLFELLNNPDVKSALDNQKTGA